MTYTLKQLTMAWTAVHDGLEPDAATLAQLQLRTNSSFSDAEALSYVINSADNSTALAALAYQFFTGKSPSKAGLDYLVNSSTNANDLNDAYYAKFGLENRYINFAANLGVQGEGAAAFAAKYGALSFTDYVASIYETIIGSSYAKAAGIDPAKAIADISSRYAAILATAQSSGMITAGMTQAQIDLAVKAATAGYLMGEAVKADVGIYAAAVDNFMLALATGTATYNTDLTKTYAPPAGSTQGTGQAVVTAPAASTVPGYVAPPPPATPDYYNFTLTTAANRFSGDVLNDTFSGTDTTFNANDTLNGGDGDDTLTITASTGSTYTVAAANVSNIETVTISNNASVTAFISGWTGVTQLNVTSGGTASVTTGATTDVTITASNGGITTMGGRNVTLNFTGGGGVIYTGTAVAGTLTANISTGATYSGTHTLKAAGVVTVNQTATNAANTTITLSDIVVYGGAATTSVVVHSTAAFTADSTHRGVVVGEVDVVDINYGSAATGVLTLIDIDGYNRAVISDTGLTTLKLAHGTGIVTLNNSGATSPATTLNLSLDAVTSGGLIDSAHNYTTLNITNAASTSSLALDTTGLTALTIAGSGSLEVYTNSTVLQTLTVTGSTSLTTSVDASVTAVTTGSGDDVVGVIGHTISKAISLGAGNDFFYLSGSGTTAMTATVDGGDGTDTLWMDAFEGQANAALYASHTVNFERLSFDNGNNFTVDLVALGGYHYVEAEDGNGFTLNGFSSGDTLVLTNSATSYIVGNANFGGANDSFNLGLKSTSAISAGSVSLSGVETIAITSDDTRATPDGSYLNSVTVLDTAATTITISGDAGLALTTNSTDLTTVDARGITLGDFTWTTANSGSTLTVYGSAHGTNTFTISARPTGNVIYEGGTGDDIVTLDNDCTTNVVHLGAGDNYFVGDATSVTAGAGDDYVRTSATGSVINLGDGHNVLISYNSEIHYTGGSGYDEVFVAVGANVVDVGSGNDYVEIDSIDPNSATVYTAITGMGAGDKLAFASAAINNSAATTLGAQTTLTGTHTLAEYLDAASTDVAGATNALHWFVLGSDLYIVSDVSDATTFVSGTDVVVKLVGAASLASTMASTTVASALITFH